MLEEKIMNDYKEAMKARDTVKTSVLSFLRAEFKNVAIEKKKNLLDDDDCITVIKKQIKRREDSIEQFKKGARQDLADKEAQEIGLLRNYLPPQLSQDEIKKIVEEAISTTVATGIKDMGRVMKEVVAKTGSAADAKTISDIVKERLTKPS